jgi:hypothetical protein
MRRAFSVDFHHHLGRLFALSLCGFFPLLHGLPDAVLR